jgi:hypothetical protein
MISDRERELMNKISELEERINILELNLEAIYETIAALLEDRKSR